MKYSKKYSVTALVALFLFLPLKVGAEQGTTQELVARLKSVIHRAEREGTGRSRLIGELNELVRLYDWIWKVSVLDDNFSDGNYDKNPRWTVDGGDFWVVRGLGLRSEVTKREQVTGTAPADTMENPAAAIFEAFLGGGTERRETPSKELSPSTGKIYTPALISNAFVIRTEVHVHGRATGDSRLELGPYLTEGRTDGYRLVYHPGQTPSLELLRHSRGRSGVIEVYNGKLPIDTDQPHVLEWRRGLKGEMSVLLNGKEVLQAADRAFQSRFAGFLLENHGGDYSFSRITVLGAESPK